jgi:hypothetical protein
MARPLTELELKALTAASKNRMTKKDVFILTSRGLLELSPEGELQLNKKAGNFMKRIAREAAAEEIRPIIWAAVEQVAQDADRMFRLDDVLKASGLNKSEHRNNILEALRFFRDGGLLTTVKLSDNNFQIFWQRTPESIAQGEE